MPVGCRAAQRGESCSAAIPTLGPAAVMLARHSDHPTPTLHAPDTPCTQRRTSRLESSAVPGSPPGNGVSATDGSRDGGGFQSIANDTPGRFAAMTTKPPSPRAAQIRPCASRSASTLLPTPTPPVVLKAGSTVTTRMIDVSGVPVDRTTTGCPRTVTTWARSNVPSAGASTVSVTGQRDARAVIRVPRSTGPMPSESTTTDAVAASHRSAFRAARAAALAAVPAPVFGSRLPGESGWQPPTTNESRHTAIRRRVIIRLSPSTRSPRAPRARGHSRRSRCVPACS